MESWHKFFNRQNLIALSIICAFIALALAAPWIAPQEDPVHPSAFRVDSRAGRTIARTGTPLAPRAGLLFGTAPGGLDVFYTLVWGVKPAMRFGLIVAVTCAVFGVLIGATSGYFGGWFNRLTMRITDAFLAFPAIAGVFLFQQVIRPMNPFDPPTTLQQLLINLDFPPVLLALVLFSWMPYARILNANIMLLKNSEYSLAAKAIGVGHTRIILRHLIPNCISPIVVMVARDVGAMVILETAFTFIGVSGYLPWGVLLVAGREWIIGPGGNPLAYWWVFLPATVLLVLFGLGWNLLGDGLNDALNPRRAL